MKEKGNDLDERTVSITSCGRGVLAFGYGAGKTI